MSFTYSPDLGITPVSPYNTVILSQRDLGLQVPINYVTAPGVSVTNACFAHMIYEERGAADCISNLFQVGFRRLEMDLFWDQERFLWILCPVSIPISVPNAAPSSTLKTGPSPISLSAIVLDATRNVLRRQATSRLKSNFLSANPSPTPSGSIVPTLVASPGTANQKLVTLGLYSCTTTINLLDLSTRLLNYTKNTETDLVAHLMFITLNLHAAASSNSPTLPAPAPTRLPDASSLLGDLLSGILSAYLYTPDNLRSDRANLNSSWYTISERYRPTPDYYSISVDANGIFSTESGWPSESYVELAHSKRLLLHWGKIDPQMTRYNFHADSGIIFPNGYIEDIQNTITANQDGQIMHGCYLDSNPRNLSVSSHNSSWATVTNVSGFVDVGALSTDLMPMLDLSSNLTYCGISTILNATLLNTTADQNFVPYANFSYASAIWSWAPNEPKDNFSGRDLRCATSNLRLGGRWTANDCFENHYAACRANGQPYRWTISSTQIAYWHANNVCPDGYLFAAPRTVLENSYLTQSMQVSQINFLDQGVWVDFNSLDFKDCWVTGGQNATCPYRKNNEAKQAVLVPTIAAVIIFVLTGLMIFVNMAGKRRVSRRRRINNGQVYEGVPS